MKPSEQTKTQSGLSVVSIHQDLSLCYIYLTIGVGSIYETPKENGLSHFIEHCIFSGTQNYKTEESIWNEIESCGANMNAMTTKDTTSIFCKIPANKIETCIKIMADMVYRPTFNNEYIEKEKKVLESEIDKNKSGIVPYSYKILLERLFKTNPVRNEIIGTKQTTQSFESKQMFDFVDKYYVPSNMALAVVGPIEHSIITELATKYFPSKSSNIEHKFENYEELSRTSTIEEKIKSSQSAVVIGFRTPNVIDPDAIGYDLVAYSIGQMATFGLRDLIRFDKSLAYSVKSGWNGYLSGSYASTLIRCLPKNIERISETATSFLEILSSETLNNKTLSRVLENYMGNWLATYDNPDLLCRKIAYCAVYKTAHTLQAKEYLSQIDNKKFLDLCQEGFKNYELIKIMSKT